MDMQAVRSILCQKDPVELYDFVQPALEQASFRDLLVDGCFAKNETYRYNCVRVFFRALAQQPDLFYPYWNRFGSMINSPNGFFRSSAVQAIAYLVSVDRNNKLDDILNTYLQMLDDEKIMVARYFVQSIHLIPQARPDLRKKIIACLLNVDTTRHTESRKSLLKADIIVAFDKFFKNLSIQEQKVVLAFAEKERESKSPSMRKTASSFLEKYAL